MFRNYVSDRKKIVFAAFLWTAIFIIVFILSGIDLKYVWYPLLLGMILFGCIFLYDYIKYRKKRKTLIWALNNIDITLENLPDTDNNIEDDYRNLLEELLIKKNQEINDIIRSKKETTEYVTLWSHQIKTPLTALQLLAGELEEENRKEILNRLFEIEQYQDMMLQYLRLENDGNDYILSGYNIRDMVNQAVKYFARIFISKGIAIKIDIPEGARVITDEKWFVFVLKQLISNALKYTKQGSINITLNNKQLIIEDTGIGIVPEDLPRIFERGYTGYNGRKDKKATGLGLYLTKQILTPLNHNIEVSSKKGEGTRVSINLENKK